MEKIILIMFAGFMIDLPEIEQNHVLIMHTLFDEDVEKVAVKPQ